MDGFVLRAVNAQDIDLLFEWANDEETRNNSFFQKMIPREEHEAWFWNMMEDKFVSQYIFEDNGIPVGRIRIHYEENQARISFSVAPQYRKRGYGKTMLKYLVHDRSLHDVDILYGEVKDTNILSQKCFLSAGFLKKDEVNRVIRYELDLHRLR